MELIGTIVCYIIIPFAIGCVFADIIFDFTWRR